MSRLQTQEIHNDETNHVRIGETGWTDAEAETPAELYRHWRAMFGGRVTKVYIDRKDGSARHVGYCFTRRQPYGTEVYLDPRFWPETSHKHPRQRCCRSGYYRDKCECCGAAPPDKRTYLRAMWCSWRAVKACPDAVAPGLCLDREATV